MKPEYTGEDLVVTHASLNNRVATLLGWRLTNGCWHTPGGHLAFRKDYVTSHDHINAAIAEWCGEDRIRIDSFSARLMEFSDCYDHPTFHAVLATPLQKTLALLAAFDALNGREG